MTQSIPFIEACPMEIVPKGWGREEWLVNTKLYCAKFLIFDPLKECSLHYHELKTETFCVLEGYIELHLNWTGAPKDYEVLHLRKGKSIQILPGLCHRIVAGAEGATVLEVSTHHKNSDSYRIVRGD